MIQHPSSLPIALILDFIFSLHDSLGLFFGKLWNLKKKKSVFGFENLSGHEIFICATLFELSFTIQPISSLPISLILGMYRATAKAVAVPKSHVIS